MVVLGKRLLIDLAFVLVVLPLAFLFVCFNWRGHIIFSGQILCGWQSGPQGASSSALIRPCAFMGCFLCACVVPYIQVVMHCQSVSVSSCGVLGMEAAAPAAPIAGAAV